MRPIHDIDIHLLLALALASKRRPAQLDEMVAAAEVVMGAIPGDGQWVESFSRLSQWGLICARDDGYTLTTQAHEIMVNPSRTADTSRRIARIKEKLAHYEAPQECPPIRLSAREVCTAVLDHRAASKRAGNTLLAPKPSAESKKARPGQRQRKPLPANRHKN